MRIATGSFRAALVGAMLVGAAAATAGTFTVNSTDDDADAVAGNGACATATGVCTLRAAIQEANALPGADVVTLPPGLFLLSRLGAGEDLAATGDLDVTESLEIDGAGAASTIVDGLGSDRVLQSTAATLTLRDFTVRRGFVAATGGGVFQSVGNVTLERMHFEQNVSMDGGGVFLGDGALTISDSIFDGNFVSVGNGGGLTIAGTGNLAITNTTFTSNGTLPSGDGGGLLAATSGGVTLTNCTFSGNTADSGAGALAAGSSAFSLDGCTFNGNRASATAGGFLYTGPGGATVANTKSLGNAAGGVGGGFIASSSGAVEVSGSEFSDNVTAGGGGGGGLFVSAATTVTIHDTVLRRNVGGTGPGGGLFASTMGTLALTDVEASDNSGATGGGLFLTGAIGSTMTLTRARALRNGSANAPGGGAFVSAPTVALADSTFDGNIAAAPGGGLYVAAPALAIANSTISNNRAAGTITGTGGGAFVVSGAGSTLSNVTFSGNVAEALGGGTFSGGNLTFRNITFADNTAPMGSAIFNGAGTPTLASSIVAGSAASHCAGGAVVSGDFNIDSNGTCGLAGGNDRNNIDPQLGPLADNGGPTLTHLPASTSPAIDGGNPSGCPATDQRGQARPTDGNGDGTAVCDVGAVEFLDLCPTDAAKTLPGICGCGVPDTDMSLANGVADCLINGELKARIARARDIVSALTGDPSEAALEAELTDIAGGLGTYVKQWKAQLVLTDPKAKLDKLAKKVKKAVKKVTRAKAGRKLDKAKTRATTALGKLDQAVAP